MLLENTIHLGDCLELMKQIPNASVDMVLCDLPYGTTQNPWDSILPLQKLWAEYGRITKDTAPIVLTAAQPFTSTIVASNFPNFKYEWIWEKEAGTGFLNAKKQPLRSHESVLVFYKKQCSYFPQMTEGKPYTCKKGGETSNYNPSGTVITENKGVRYPKTVLRFSRDKDKVHPTQKPVALWEYLIKTYTNPGDLVLDNCAGSGTTAVACRQTGRRYLCIEKDRDYWLKACERVNQSNGLSDVAWRASQIDVEPKTEPPLA